jgi:predicted porin
MKKTLLAMAALASCGGAFAQSSVTLYGLADVGITSVSGYRQGRVTALSSGIMEGSRWGLRVNEDMGGGWRALVTLESRVELDTGSTGNRPPSGNQIPDRLTAGLPTAVGNGLTNQAIGPTLGVNVAGNLFDRQAFVGLVTPVGGILAGRQYTPAFEALATFDIMGTQSALSPGQLVTVPVGVDIRANNSLQYRLVLGPWNAAAMWALGETGGKNLDEGSLLGVNGFYKGSAFSVGFGHNSKKNSAGQQALKSTVVGASSSFGKFTVSGLYGLIDELNPSSGPELSAGLAGGATPVPAPLIASILDRLKQDAALIHVGARYDMGAAGSVTVAYNQINDKRSSNADAASYGVAYTYPLSKRTNLNAVLTRFNNKGTAQFAPGGNGYLGGVTASAGTDSNSIALGIRHSF